LLAPIALISLGIIDFSSQFPPKSTNISTRISRKSPSRKKRALDRLKLARRTAFTSSSQSAPLLPAGPQHPLDFLAPAPLPRARRSLHHAPATPLRSKAHRPASPPSDLAAAIPAPAVARTPAPAAHQAHRPAAHLPPPRSAPRQHHHASATQAPPQLATPRACQHAIHPCSARSLLDACTRRLAQLHFASRLPNSAWLPAHSPTPPGR
jgi:hypothetical protein